MFVGMARSKCKMRVCCIRMPPIGIQAVTTNWINNNRFVCTRKHFSLVRSERICEFGGLFFYIFLKRESFSNANVSRLCEPERRTGAYMYIDASRKRLVFERRTKTTDSLSGEKRVIFEVSQESPSGFYYEIKTFYVVLDVLPTRGNTETDYSVCPSSLPPLSFIHQVLIGLCFDRSHLHKSFRYKGQARCTTRNDDTDNDYRCPGQLLYLMLVGLGVHGLKDFDGLHDFWITVERRRLYRRTYICVRT